jgi:CubicO group peptidase (beta-lactamase class C family)
MNFAALDERMQWYIDEKILSCIATVVLDGNDVVHSATHGYMSIHDKRPLEVDAIFRMYSNTKLLTSVGLMMLYESGDVALDDPLSAFLPDFSTMRVLRSNAPDETSTEPLRNPITVRHILSHSAGFSYGFLDPRSAVDQAYIAADVNPVSSPGFTLESLAGCLSELPLAFQPGTDWRYSFATDLCARVIEVVSGLPFDEYLKIKLIEPLGMQDTDFWVPEDKQERFVSQYNAPDLLDPMKAGFNLDDAKLDRRTKRPTFLSGGGGLVASVADYTTFIQMLIAGGTVSGRQYLKPQTLALMRSNQLADGVFVKLPGLKMPDTVFGFGFAINTSAAQPSFESSKGEYYWGGMAGTHSWVAPGAGIAGLCFTQRMPGFWHPFSHDFRRFVYSEKQRVTT